MPSPHPAQTATRIRTRSSHRVLQKILRLRSRLGWIARQQALKAVRAATAFAAMISLSTLAPSSVRAERAASVTSITAPRITHPGLGQVMYFILTDRFANGSPANDSGGIAGGPDVSGFDPTRISHFHGGDLAGLTAHLDYIKNLGVTTIWVTPPFKNKPMQNGSAGYHGYWILDFLHVDPHLGSDADFAEFVRQAHARGLKVCLDIVINHTADVIQFRDGRTDYVEHAKAPYRDASGRAFDPHDVAFNGLGSPEAFPKLSAERSFAHVPYLPAGEENAKNPAWLNDPIHYHNRGNSTFVGDSSLDGDFGGLDDVFTEQPAVVRGFIDIYRHWIEHYGVDGFRIDTVRHVNLEFWQAFAPAMREAARRAGRPGFVQFGEVANDTGDIDLLSAFSTTAPLDASLDFAFRDAAREFVSKEKSGALLDELFEKGDDYYTDHDSNAQTSTTFLGNHDQGRFAYFLQHDNPGATPGQLAELVKLGYALLFFTRGQPVVYYGDEQGMIGRGGWDQQAREDMFASQAPDFKNAALLATTRTGADDKFDPAHPFYRFIHSLAVLRTGSVALSRGAMIPRSSGSPHVFAFSRVEHDELVEYLAAFNNSRTDSVEVTLPTSQPSGAAFEALFDSTVPDNAPAALDAHLTLVTDSAGRVAAQLKPLQAKLWRATKLLPVSTRSPAITIASPIAGARLVFPTRDVDGHRLAIRQEIRADVTGSDGVGEVTFVMTRASRPGQLEVLGTDDAPPYRVLWQPPPDLAAGEEFSVTASFDDRRGRRVATRVDHLSIAADTPKFGIVGASVPRITVQPRPHVALTRGSSLELSVEGNGTGPLVYQWLHNGAEIPGAVDSVLKRPGSVRDLAGTYRVIVRGLAGSVLSSETSVTTASQ